VQVDVAQPEPTPEPTPTTPTPTPTTPTPTPTPTAPNWPGHNRPGQYWPSGRPSHNRPAKPQRPDATKPSHAVRRHPVTGIGTVGLALGAGLLATAGGTVVFGRKNRDA